MTALRKVGLGLLLIGIMGLVGACQPPAAPVTLLPRPTQPTATASPTATPCPTATTVSCPIHPDVSFPPAPQNLPGAADILGTYLAQGGDPAAIPQALPGWGFAPRSGASLVQADLTGDGATEITVAMEQFKEEEPAAQLLVYSCQEGEMRPLYAATLGEWFSVNLIGAADLTADGVADLVFAEVSCGAHTCWHTLHLWSWTGSDFQERVNDDLTYPYPTFSLRGQTLLVRSDGIASVGAGPQRPYTDTLSWNGHALTVTNTIIGPVVYRYHMLTTGDEALYAEKYAEARAAYERVLADDSLKPWDAIYQPDEERTWLTALARWRLLTIATQAQDYTAAEAQLQHLQSDFPAGTAGASVSSLAQTFWAQVLDTGNIAYGCQAIRQTSQMEDVLAFLNDYGYANPVYTAQDICPFTTP